MSTPNPPAWSGLAVPGAPEGPYGTPGSGQPAPLQDGEWEPAVKRPYLFGGGFRNLVGTPRQIIAATPVAGSEWSFTWSGSSWAWLRTVFFTLGTSATVTNRTPNLRVAVKGTVVAQWAALAVEPAGSSFQFCASSAAVGGGGAGVVAIPIVDALIIHDAVTISTVTTNLQAGDTYTAIALYLEEFTDACY